MAKMGKFHGNCQQIPPVTVSFEKNISGLFGIMSLVSVKRVLAVQLHHNMITGIGSLCLTQEIIFTREKKLRKSKKKKKKKKENERAAKLERQLNELGDA
jgi:hypothetical protein